MSRGADRCVYHTSLNFCCGVERAQFGDNGLPWMFRVTELTCEDKLILMQTFEDALMHITHLATS